MYLRCNIDGKPREAEDWEMLRRRPQVEALALETIERIKKGGQPEWDIVELKSEWIEPASAARRIAGHANAARGEGILWLVGVDAKAGTFPGVPAMEFSTWWPQVKSCFDGQSPTLACDFPMTANGGAEVYALYFDTEAAPFVVKNPNFGKVRGEAASLEVPWREGTQTRTATRADLLRILVPAVTRPNVDLLAATLAEPSTWDFGNMRIPAACVTLRLYVAAPGGERVFFPAHLLRGTIESNGTVDELLFSRFTNAGAEEINATASQGVINGSGVLTAQLFNPSLQDSRVEEATLDVSFETSVGHHYFARVQLSGPPIAMPGAVTRPPIASWISGGVPLRLA